VETITSVARELGEVQKKYVKDFVVEDYVSEFKFGLVEVVYEWARGTVSEQSLASRKLYSLFLELMYVVIV